MFINMLLFLLRFRIDPLLYCHRYGPDLTVERRYLTDWNHEQVNSRNDHGTPIGVCACPPEMYFDYRWAYFCAQPQIKRHGTRKIFSWPSRFLLRKSTGILSDYISHFMFVVVDKIVNGILNHLPKHYYSESIYH